MTFTTQRGATVILKIKINDYREILSAPQPPTHSTSNEFIKKALKHREQKKNSVEWK